jgi:hypothetical protein
MARHPALRVLKTAPAGEGITDQALDRTFNQGGHDPMTSRMQPDPTRRGMRSQPRDLDVNDGETFVSGGRLAILALS